ncbi:Beta-lactamase-related domain-containing protein [Plasmodiophora brassicae]
MMYRCRDITAQCGWLSPQEWAPSVNRLVNDVTKTRVQAGQVIATNAAPFTETDWIIASNVLAELDNPKSFSLLFALNMGVLLMGRTSDVMMAKQTQQSLRLSTERGGTLDVRLLRVKTRETQVLPVAETMEPTPVRNLLNAYAYHMGVLGALAVGEQDEPFLFPDAVRAGNESAFFGGIFKEVYRVLDANGMRQHVTDGLTNHSLRNCGFTKALGHPQLSAASAAMYGGWSDQAWSRGRSGTSAAAKYHCYEQKELDRCARAVRGCHDLSLGGHHPTLPVFDHRWAATDWRRQVYDFGSLWCVSNERYVHPSMIAAMSASLHIWFDYWKRESGIGSYRCHCIRQ